MQHNPPTPTHHQLPGSGPHQHAQQHPHSYQLPAHLLHPAFAAMRPVDFTFHPAFLPPFHHTGTQGVSATSPGSTINPSSIYSHYGATVPGSTGLPPAAHQLYATPLTPESAAAVHHAAVARGATFTIDAILSKDSRKHNITVGSAGSDSGNNSDSDRSPDQSQKHNLKSLVQTLSQDYEFERSSSFQGSLSDLSRRRHERVTVYGHPYLSRDFLIPDHMTDTAIGNLHTPEKSERKSRAKRIRTIFTPEQLDRMENEFERQQYMVGTERYYLANELNLTEAQVKVWFQNRRIKWRKQTLEKQLAKLATSELYNVIDSTSEIDSDAVSSSSPLPMFDEDQIDKSLTIIKEQGSDESGYVE